MTYQKKLRARASRAEKRVAEALGGRKTFLSGAGVEKGDVTVRQGWVVAGGALRSTKSLTFRVEVKTTGSVNFALKSTDWQDIVISAEKVGQVPMMVIEIDIGRVPAKFAVIRRTFFSELTNLKQLPPMAERDRDVRSFTLFRHALEESVLSDLPFRRLVLEMSLIDPVKGDVVVLDYHDLLRVLKGAGE